MSEQQPMPNDDAPMSREEYERWVGDQFEWFSHPNEVLQRAQDYLAGLDALQEKHGLRLVVDDYVMASDVNLETLDGKEVIANVFGNSRQTTREVVMIKRKREGENLRLYLDKKYRHYLKAWES